LGRDLTSYSRLGAGVDFRPEQTIGMSVVNAGHRFCGRADRHGSALGLTFP
jgi:hypothetical protein